MLGAQETKRPEQSATLCLSPPVKSASAGLRVRVSHAKGRGARQKWPLSPNALGVTDFGRYHLRSKA